jgi:DNA gyrase subunit A
VDVIRRRSHHDLEQARAQAHIIDGLLLALARIEEVIAVIRASKDRERAGAALQAEFELSAEQAKAILDMRLARLTSLETAELKQQLRELKKHIKELEAILRSEKRQLEVLLEELDAIVAKHGDDRRTTIVEGAEEYEVEDLVAEEQVVISLSHQAYLKRVPVAQYRRRASRGLAVAGMDRHEEDFLEHVFVASTTDTLLFFTDRGQAHAVSVVDVPEAGPSSRGRALAQVLTLAKGTRVAALVPVSTFSEDRSLLFLTAHGTVKRTGLDQYASIRAGGIAAVRVADDDRLLDVQISEEGSDVVLVTRDGRAIRFPVADVPVMGRVAQGVRGVQLRKGDAVIGMVVVRRDATLCTVTELGYAKRTPLSEYPVQKRGGIGTITLDVTTKTGPLVAAKELLPGDELMVITAAGKAIRIGAADVPEQGRATQGKRLLRLGEGDRVVEVARVASEGAGERSENGDTDGARRGEARRGRDQLELID